MADAMLIRGGRPDINFMWCEKDHSQFFPVFGGPNLDMTPPYDAHIDGAYNIGHFTLGMPIVPNGVGMDWQRKAMIEAALKADDAIHCIAVPYDSFATAINFKIARTDSRLAGASVALTAYEVIPDGNGGRTITEIDDVENAVAAQAALSPIPVDKPCNVFVSLMKNVGGYAVPLYAEPTIPGIDANNPPTYGRVILLSLKVVTLPADQNITLDMARNGWYMSAKLQSFECPTHY